MTNPILSTFQIYANMLRQAGVSTEVRTEMPSHSIKTAMKYGRQARKKERAAETLEEFAKI
jgi:hypothetical protein